MRVELVDWAWGLNLVYSRINTICTHSIMNNGHQRHTDEDTTDHRHGQSKVEYQPFFDLCPYVGVEFITDINLWTRPFRSVIATYVSHCKDFRTGLFKTTLFWRIPDRDFSRAYLQHSIILWQFTRLYTQHSVILWQMKFTRLYI